MNTYRYILERYRGRGTRYTCPQCGRKYTFTRYIDTENNNQYLSERVGKCNRLDKCGYHYTPREYFADNPHKRDDFLVVGGSLRPFTDNPWKRNGDVELWKKIGLFNKSTPTPRPICTIPEWVVEGSINRGVRADHLVWIINTYGIVEAERIATLYGIGATKEGASVFWQRDIEGRVRTGKIMAYDPISGHRKKEAGSINWVHSIMQQRGQLPEDWQLTQCLYGEHLLPLHPDAVVGIVEAYKTAHVGAILHPDMVWLATDSLSGLTAERLSALKGRRIILYPDEGRGYIEWQRKIEPIAREVGFSYRISEFVEEHLPHGTGADIADMVISKEVCPF